MQQHVQNKTIHVLNQARKTIEGQKSSNYTYRGTMLKSCLSSLVLVSMVLQKVKEAAMHEIDPKHNALIPVNQ